MVRSSVPSHIMMRVVSTVSDAAAKVYLMLLALSGIRQETETWVCNDDAVNTLSMPLRKYRNARAELLQKGHIQEKIVRSNTGVQLYIRVLHGTFHVEGPLEIEERQVRNTRRKAPVLSTPLPSRRAPIQRARYNDELQEQRDKVLRALKRVPKDIRKLVRPYLTWESERAEMRHRYKDEWSWNSMELDACRAILKGLKAGLDRDIIETVLTRCASDKPIGARWFDGMHHSVPYFFGKFSSGEFRLIGVYNYIQREQASKPRLSRHGCRMYGAAPQQKKPSRTETVKPCVVLTKEQQALFDHAVDKDWVPDNPSVFLKVEEEVLAMKTLIDRGMFPLNGSFELFTTMWRNLFWRNKMMTCKPPEVNKWLTCPIKDMQDPKYKTYKPWSEHDEFRRFIPQAEQAVS